MNGEGKSSRRSRASGSRPVKRVSKRTYEDDFESDDEDMLGSLLGEGEGGKSEDEDEVEDRVQLALKKARKLAKRGKFVHLGLLWKPTDSGYQKSQERTRLELTTRLSVRAKAEYKKPVNWFQFSLLFHRFLMLLVEFHPNRVVDVVNYFEKLLVKVNLGMCSVEAIIEYDHRMRESHAGSWRWLTYCQEAFEVARAAYPSTEGVGLGVFGRAARPTGSRAVPEYGNSGGRPRSGTWGSSGGPTGNRYGRGSLGDRQRDRSWLGGNGSNHGRPEQPYSANERSKRGYCHAWASGQPCPFKNQPRGCRFAHWCVEPKCLEAGDNTHLPGKCPV